MSSRRELLGAAAGLAAGLALPDITEAASTPATAHVLRYAFPTAETSFDPQAVLDLYSRNVTGHIFEALFEYDHLARPFKLKPALAAEMPEVSADFRTFVVKLRRGVFFQDDPAFGGQPRELTADDVVYTYQRMYDPASQSLSLPGFEEHGVVGLRELRDAALASKQPFDYQKPVAGLQALDRYTVRFVLREGRPRFTMALANPDILGIMAREVVQHYGEHIGEHPVGTGPFQLAAWRRSSQIVLERHPGYRERYYDAEPNADDAEGQALLARFKGRRLPMLDRVEIAIIEEAQPRWLSFLNQEQDLLQIVPPEFVPQAIPGGELAPTLLRQGIVKHRVPASDVYYYVFNMDNAVVGGLGTAQVALRRAMAAGFDAAREVALARRGEAIAAHGLNPPGTYGYDPGLRTIATQTNRARARALLDMAGYVDRDGDGWREAPDGQPLRIELLAQSDQTNRALDEVFKSSMDAIGVRVDLKIGQWSENLKATRSGRYMMWRVGSSASSPDGQGAMERCYSRSIGKSNLARFSLPAFDVLYEQLQALPDGPERLALFTRANKLALAYMPYRMSVHRILCDLTRPQLVGYRRPPFWPNWWHLVDVVAKAQASGIDSANGGRLQQRSASQR